MDTRRSQPRLGQERPLPPARSVSHSGLHFAKPHTTRPTLPSRLSNVRSVSQPLNVVDLTERVGNVAAFLSNREKVCMSPDVIEVEDEDGDGDEEPPAKRAKTAGDGFRAGQTTPEHMERVPDKAHAITPGPPLPSLPKPTPSKPKSDPFASRRSSANNPARRAHGTDPPPLATRLPPPKLVADFSPWLGTHPEDILTEAVIKAGYSDKPSSAATESNSAKPSLWPNLCQKNNMGLQTLSYLFAQVLEKRQVLGKVTAPATFKPPPRVTVTDSKRETWLRDLANVEVPLRKQSRTIPHGIRGKGLMDQCLSKDVPLPRAVWLAKCVGANELRAFRRKGVSGSAAASGEGKWIRDWTICVEQFVEGVVGACGEKDWQRRMNYAIKLAASFYAEKLLDEAHYLDWIVSAFAAATLDMLPVWIVVVQVFWRDVTKFARRGRKLAESLLQRLEVMAEAGEQGNGVLRLRLQKLVSVLAVTSRGCLIMPHTWEKYKHLLAPKADDTTNTAAESAAVNITKRNERLAAPLRKTPANTRCALLDLYTELDAMGLNVDIPTLTDKCLRAAGNSTTIVPALLSWASSPYRQGLARIYLAAGIIAQLRQSGEDTDSAVLGFLQTPTLQASNVYKVVVELVRTESFSTGRYMQWLITSGILSSGEERPALAVGLLAAIPADALTGSLGSVRRTLLKRAGVFAEESGVDVVSRILTEGEAVSADDFYSMREAYEVNDNIPALAELLKTAAKTSEDPALLATVTDTLDLYAEPLAILGQLQPLTDQMITRYRLLRTQQGLDRNFVLALTRLLKPQTADTELLHNDLAACEQQGSVAVCSPASDSLVGMQASRLESDADIDAVFASGNSMDDGLMGRVFGRVIVWAEKSANSGDEVEGRVGRWLSQLRALGTGVFERLATSYVQEALREGRKLGVVVALVASDCFGLEHVLLLARAAGSAETAAAAVTLLLQPHLADDGCLHMNEAYRYKLLQQRCCDEHALLVCELLCAACEDPGFEVEDERVTDLLVRYTFGMPDEVKGVFKQSCKSEAAVANAGRLCRALVQRGLPLDSTKEQLDVDTIVRLADPLSIRFCVGALEFYTKSEDYRARERDEKMQGLLKEAIDSGNPVWPQLLEAVGAGVRKELHVWAREKLLLAEQDMSERDLGPETLARYTDVLDITFGAVIGYDDTATVVLLADRLKDAEKALGYDENTKGKELRSLDILLHLCTLHVQTTGAETDSSRQARGHLLTSLCALLIHPHLQPQRSLCEYIQDLASTLSDTLPEQAAPKLSLDTRLHSILGGPSIPAQSDTSLALASHQRPRAGPSRPWTTRAQALPVEMKTTSFPLRKWEILSEPTPVLGENDGSLGLGLFEARKV